MSKTYEIQFWRSLTGSCYVEADSEEEAREKFDQGDMAYDEANEDCGEELRITNVILAEKDE